MKRAQGTKTHPVRSSASTTSSSAGQGAAPSGDRSYGKSGAIAAGTPDDIVSAAPSPTASAARDTTDVTARSSTRRVSARATVTSGAAPAAAGKAIVVTVAGPADSGAPVAGASATMSAAASSVTTEPTLNSIVAGLISGISGLFGGNGGAGDPVPTLEAGVFEWVRRTFFYEGPTVAPVQYVQTGDGQVLGSIGATDPYGGALTYKVVNAPKFGTVTVADDGTYTYTPAPSLAAQGVTDSFTVAVAEPGFHINLLNLFAGPTTAAVTVNVDGDPKLGGGLTSTKGFDIYNASSVPITYTGYTVVDQGGVSGPVGGETIQPGERLHFELTQYAVHWNTINANFTSSEGDSTIRLTIGSWTDNFNEAWAGCSGSGGQTCAAAGQTAMLLDPAGTVINVPSTDAVKQAQILNQLCQNGSSATCSFRATSQERIQSDPHLVGSQVINNSDVQNSTTVSISDAQQESSSVKVALKEKIEFIISGEASQEYGYTWTTTHTFTQSITVNLPPHTKGSVTATQPIFRMHGDFTLKLGNSTWVLKDVYFDSPDPNGTGNYIINTTPLTAAEIANDPVGISIAGEPAADSTDAELV
jgi:hypothetical protein